MYYFNKIMVVSFHISQLCRNAHANEVWIRGAEEIFLATLKYNFIIKVDSLLLRQQRKSNE